MARSRRSPGQILEKEKPCDKQSVITSTIRKLASIKQTSSLTPSHTGYMRARQARRIKHIGANCIMPYVGAMTALAVMSSGGAKQ